MANLPVDEQALRHYLIGLALEHGDRDHQAIAALRRCLRKEQSEDAQAEGERALAAGLSDRPDRTDSAAPLYETRRILE